MKKIHLLYFSFLFISYAAKAQYTDQDYKITYKLKLEGVFSPGDAKIAKSHLVNLFDSRSFSYSQIDSIITIRSSINSTQEKLSGRINELGYNILFFSKKIDDLETNEK